MISQLCQHTLSGDVHCFHTAAFRKCPVTDDSDTITKGNAVQTITAIERIVADTNQFLTNVQCYNIAGSGENTV